MKAALLNEALFSKALFSKVLPGNGGHRIAPMSLSLSHTNGSSVAGVNRLWLLNQALRRVLCCPASFLTLLATAQLAAVTAAVVALSFPSLISWTTSYPTSKLIHQHIVRAYSGESSARGEASTTTQRKLALLSETIRRYGHSEDTARELAVTILRESQLAKVDPLLVAAVVKYESSFRTSAVSHKGARGLMQVMPRTEQALVQRINTRNLDLHDRQIRLGAHYLAELKQRFKGNLYHSLIAYNWGPTNLSVALKRGGKIPQGPQEYARRVLAQRENWLAKKAAGEASRPNAHAIRAAS